MDTSWQTRDMSEGQLFEVLLGRGFHSGYIDDLSSYEGIEGLQELVESGDREE